MPTFPTGRVTPAWAPFHAKSPAYMQELAEITAEQKRMEREFLLIKRRIAWNRVIEQAMKVARLLGELEVQEALKSWRDQPRVLAGNPGGGQWTDEGGGGTILREPESDQDRYTQVAEAGNTVYDASDAAYHKYSKSSIVCRAELKCTKDQMADQLSRYAVPGQDPSQPLVSGFMYGVSDPRTGLPAGYVTSTISADGLTIVNSTTPFHIFHEGQITRTVHEQPDGSWAVTTTGEGVNFNRIFSEINQDQGPKIFGTLDQEMKRNIEERGYGFTKETNLLNARGGFSSDGFGI